MDISWTILILALATYVKAKPRCTKQRQTNVVCVSSGSNYVLVRGLVSDNSKTTNITMRNCGITDISLESFYNLPNLKYIDISHNKISALVTGTLDEAAGITHLNVSYNKITTITVATLDIFSKLEVLDLRGNKITTIDSGSFDRLEKLTYVDLSNNELIGKNLKPFLFQPATLVQHLDISGNDMSEVPEDFFTYFTVLEFLNLSRCSFNTPPQFLTNPNLNTLKYLILSGNNISSLEEPDTFGNFENLESLDLADNGIEILGESMFETLTNVKSINLQNNKLKTIPDTLFQKLPKLTTVSLSQNYLENVPVNAFTETDLKTLILSKNRITYLQDNFCLELRNSGVMLKEFFFDDNPWQCACLRDILKETKEFNIHYDSSKYQGQFRVCATTQDFSCKREESVNKFYEEIYDNSI